MLIVLSGPSGVGKTTVIDRLLNHPELRSKLRFSISATTRAPRPGEQDGINYHFKTRGEFETLIEQDAFIEWAQVHNGYYGTPRSELDTAHEQGKDLLLEIDVQGAAALREKFPDALLVFLTVSEENLRRRLENRPSALSPESLSAEITLRMNNARQELAQAGHYDYVVENHDLDVTVRRIVSIIKEENQARA